MKKQIKQTLNKGNNKKDKKREERANKPNVKVIVYSILALGFLALGFFVDWLFIIGAIVLVALNQRELMRARH